MSYTLNLTSLIVCDINILINLIQKFKLLNNGVARYPYFKSKL